MPVAGRRFTPYFHWFVGQPRRRRLRLRFVEDATVLRYQYCYLVSFIRYVDFVVFAASLPVE